MGIEVFFNSDGTGVTAAITVIDSNGSHVDPDSWPITNDPAIVLSSHPSAAKTVTKVDTGVYTAEWSSLSPALNNGDIVNIAIDGAISSVAWTTWRNFLQVMRLPASQSSVDTVDTVVDAIKVKTDQLTFTVSNQVDANALTGGGGDDAATIYTYFTTGTNEDAFKADVSSLASQTSVDNLNDISAADVYTHFTTGTNEDAFKADVSALATASSIAALNDFDPSTQTVTTDSASRTASQADVSALATAANLATVDTVVDGIKVVTDNLPNSGALTDLATAAALTTVDTVVDAIKVTTDKLDDTLELDGSEYRFTANALEEAPTGGGGSAPTEAEIYTYFTASSREDVFKADVSALATSASISALNDFDPATETVTTDSASRTASQADVSALATSASIAALNDLSSADVTAAVPTVGQTADAVWDEPLAGHNVGGATGKALRQLKEGVISVDGSVDDSSATTTTFISNLTETTDGFYHDKVITFISGDLSGQARHIETYTGSTKSITVSQAFTSAPADGDEFLILATHEHSINEIQSGLATAASIAALNDLSSADVTAAVPTAAQIRTEIDSNSTQLALLVDGQGFQLTILAGAINNAGTATETYTYTYNSTDYAATYAGLDTSGNRGTTVLSKP